MSCDLWVVAGQSIGFFRNGMSHVFALNFMAKTIEFRCICHSCYTHPSYMEVLLVPKLNDR
jgi:hypothetical protein